MLYLCTTKKEQCSVRLAGPGRKILILEIMGSNPIPSTTETSANAEVFFFYATQRDTHHISGVSQSKEGRQYVVGPL